ncbi:MAG: cell wall-active antibiotics response protein [Clostridiales bacterium]|nr:cell wall-active antibiotics response protein [Clostridiales bacterium]
MNRKFSSVFWGIALILIGVGYGGEAIGIWNFSILFPGWWTLLIIIPSLISMFESGVNAGNSFGAIIGILLLLKSLRIINGISIYKLFLPIILVLVGISILFTKKSFIKDKASKISEGEIIRAYAIFGGQTVKPLNEKFYGASTVSVFGGTDIDLRMAIINEDTVIKVTVVMGGTDIFVPPNVNVKISGIPIFGGIDNKVAACPIQNAPTIYIDAICIFGGVEVK